MATSKTLTPTNVTIQIPDFTERPDQRVNSNCIDKEADAINALNSNFTSLSDQIAMQNVSSNVQKNATYIASNSGITAFKTGRICLIELDLNIITSIPTNTAILTGLPKPYGASYIATKNFYATIDEDGNLKTNGAVSTTGWSQGGCAYVTLT